MEKFKIYRCLLLAFGYFLTIGPTFLLSQTGQNPFDVRQRLQVPLEKDQKEKIRNEVETISSDVENVSLPDTVHSLKNQVKSESSLTNGSNNYDLNDFEVDHVPIIKSKLGKRKVNLNQLNKKADVSNGFLFWILLFSCFLLAMVLNTKNKALRLISKSIFNENMLKLYQREESSKFSLYLLIYYFIFCLNLSVLIYLISKYYGGPNGITTFFLILIGVISIYVVRHLSLTFLGEVFMVTKNAQLYSFTVMIFNVFLGLFLIPLNFILAFGPEFLQGSIVIFSYILIGAILVLRTLRGIFIISEFLTDRLFQIFIYLCAFEISPILILIKSVLKFAF